LGRKAGFIILMFSGCCCLPGVIDFRQPAFGQEKEDQSAKKDQGAQEGSRSNPFLTQKEQKALVEMGNVIPLEYLNVSAIFYSSFNSRNRAIIDGKVLVSGDIIDNKQIIKINPEDVVLEDSQGKYVAKIAKLKTNNSDQ
jgi:hypothetical protein